MTWNWQQAIWHWGLWESMQPGAFTGREVLDCPYCGTSLDIEVFHRYGCDDYACCECGGAFEIDWANGQIQYEQE